MDKLTYRQAYDKIIEAYFKDQISPMKENFCFCGTLCGNRTSWSTSAFRPYFHNYSYEEYGNMEKALFSVWPQITWFDNANVHVAGIDITVRWDYEEKLFQGMSAALDVLKEIHRSRGENVDEDIPAFTKRELAKAI